LEREADRLRPDEVRRCQRRAGWGAVTAALIAAVGAVLATVLGVVLTQRLRPREISDKEQFRNWRDAFDRAAFKGPYTWHSDPDAFLKAIKDTLRTINTGAQYDGQRLLTTGKGRGRIRNARWRAEMKEIERKLSYIRQSVEERGALAPELATLPEPPGQPRQSLPERMDEARDEIIIRLNRIWSDLGIEPLEVPTTVTTFSSEWPER
jgi:hypothetical protein